MEANKIAPAEERMRVEFVPSIDSFIHISSALGKSVEQPKIVKIGVGACYFLNVIVVPAILLFHFHSLLGLLVFGLNVLFAIFVLPWINKTYHRAYFKRALKGLENEPYTVEVRDEGVGCEWKGTSGFVPWTRIEAVEETDATIFLLYGHNGIAVEKNGFDSIDELDRFLRFAHSHKNAQQ